MGKDVIGDDTLDLMCHRFILNLNKSKWDFRAKMEIFFKKNLLFNLNIFRILQ